MKLSPALLTIGVVAAIIGGFYFYSAGQKAQQQTQQQFTEENSGKTVRNNWNYYIYNETASYLSHPLGGIDAFQIPIRNNTDYLIDEVDVKVDYIKAAGGVFTQQQVQIFNIAPHSVKMGQAPSSPRGTSVNLKISQVVSRGLNLCFPGKNSDYSDPYRCN